MENEYQAGSNRNRWKKLGAGGWLLAGGAVLVLVALWRWSETLAPEKETSASDSQTAGPVPDGDAKWGELQPVTFPGEGCRPWHVSAVSNLPPPPGDVLLVASKLADTYGFIAAGFEQECGRLAQTILVEEANQSQISALPEGGAVAIGAAAVEWYSRQRPGAEVFFAAVANPQARGWDRPPYAGISPWVPANALWARLQKLLPARAHLDILAAARAGTTMVEALRQTIESSGRQLGIYRYTDEKDLRNLLNDLTKGNHAWLVLWDASSAFEKEFEIIIRAAEKAALPVAVSDEDHVRLGALAGVGTDSFRIGQQLCHLLRAQKAGLLPETQRIFCPEYSFGVVHQARAEKLGYIFEGPLQIKVYKWH